VSSENAQTSTGLRRRFPVVIVGLLFVSAGIVGLVYHAGEIDLHHPFEFDVVAVLVVRLLAIVGGVFVLLCRNWARWLLIGWLGYHVVLSAFHSPGELVFHFVLLVVISWLLFRAGASPYFSR